MSSADDQSEDGELRHSPPEAKPKDEVLDFSLSEEDVDTADSLDIKPPQANRLPHATGSANRTKRRERNREGRTRHGRSERHREQERGHRHREKHHTERTNRDRERENYRDKEHFRERELYREKELYVNSRETRETRYTDGIATASYKETKYIETQYRVEPGRRDEPMKYEPGGPQVSASASRDIRYLEARKYEEKRSKEHERYSEKDLRYVQESEKYRRYEDKPERRMKSTADQALDDLRERLLDKKRIKESSESKESRRRARAELDSFPSGSAAVEQDAEMYVKEIIDLSGGAEEVGRERKERERNHKKEEREEKEEIKEPIERKLTDAESEEQELRKEKLLQAEREIARQKEQYKVERDRRHQRRQERQEAKRRLQEEQQELANQQRKRQRMSGELGQYKDKDLSIVTVSDGSSHSHSGSNSSNSSHSSEHSAHTNSAQSNENTNSEDEREDEDSRAESSSGEEHNEEDNEDEEGREKRNRRQRYRSDEEERDVQVYREEERVKSNRSSSRSRSKSPSPKSNGQLNEKDEKEKTEPKPKSPEPVLKKLDEGLPPYFPAIQGCRSVEEFQCLNRIEEGTYGVVYRARDKRTEEIVALKRLKMEKEKEGFPITSLREINTLLKGQHPNIVTVREIVVGSNMDKIFIVMDYVEHDLKSLMETMRNRRQGFVPGEVKCLLRQLLGAVAHLHDNWILHRDLKTSNLLLSHKGILKVGDFGLAREYGSPLKPYTPIVVTLWYRAPELLLCCKEYSTPIDIWSVGCIFAELLLMKALFPGKSEVDQLNKIFQHLGTPNERIWPGYNELPAVKKMKFTEFPVSQLRQHFSMLTDTGLALLERFLTYDPAQRVTAEEALKHAYFTEAPLPIDPAMFPTWPAKSELGHRKALAASPKPPSGGREYKQLGDGDEDSALGFHMGTSTAASLMEARRLAMGGGFSLKF